MKKPLLLGATFLTIAILFSSLLIFRTEADHPVLKKIRSSSSPHASIKMKKARDEYFLEMLKDPATGKIPANIRFRELEYAKLLSEKLSKPAAGLNWKEAGPFDVGGRTRALAIDVNNPNTIIAGGISGGIWKSTDNGNSWFMKSTSSQLLSVTSIAQDTRAGHTDTWYYTTGEYSGNSAFDRGFTAKFSGNGVYKSIDNGETWSVLSSTASENPTTWDGNFDYSSRVVVNPQTGSVFVASNGIGIFKSVNGGNSFTLNLGGLNHHIHSDIVASANGTLLATISSPFAGETPAKTPGIYKSTDDGANWTNITPGNFPTSHSRTVLAIAPSNQNTAYILTALGTSTNRRENLKFYKLNIPDGTYDDRSANLPDFGNNYEDFVNTYNGYTMVVAVKPDDENLVIIGASSLFRSFDGFATKPASSKFGWIGGYHNENPWRYPNLHPDVHSFAFVPGDPNKVWFGNDGGLSFCANIASTTYAKYLPWESKNNNYNITQFYHVSLPAAANDNRIMGGTQDNGTPYLTFNGNTSSTSSDVSGGDGSYSYFAAQTFGYTSSQNGFITRRKYNSNGKPDENVAWSVIQPSEATNQLFINPFAVDPNNENVMYYPAGNVLWRNNDLSGIPDYQQNGTMTGWTKLDNVSISQEYIISAMTISTSPAHILYFAASNFNGSAPKIYRLENAATTNSDAVEISIPTATKGYVHEIAVNPDNANEIIVVLSNYNIVGLYHSNNGGQSYTAIEGNLEGTQQNPGPSLRTANILPTNNGTLYFVGTSIGLFSTSSLNGSGTSWTQESFNGIGNVVISKIASRTSDLRIVAATHGRGMFVANAVSGGNPVATVDVQQLNLNAKPGESGSAKFMLKNTGDATLNYNITANGQFQLLSSPGNVIHPLSKPMQSKMKFNSGSIKTNFPVSEKSSKLSKSIPASTLGNDIIVYDDGDNTSDNFLGFGAGGDNFGWANEYILDKDFSLEKFQFFMRTKDGISNDVYVAIYNKDLDVLAEGNISLQMAEDGDWFEINITPALNFPAGEKFYIYTETKGSQIPYPAGVDVDAQVQNKSFYWDGSKLVNFNTISGFENSAALIRAIGTLSGGPQNRLTVEPVTGTIPANGQQEITVTLNAVDLLPDTYNGEINITGNGGNIRIPLKMIVSNILDVSDNNGLPKEFYLEQNFPNPFNPSTKIKYGLSTATDVKLTIYNSNGEVVTEIINTHQNPGTYEAVWNGRDHNGNNSSSGIYFYRLAAGNYIQTRKMLLIK